MIIRLFSTSPGTSLVVAPDTVAASIKNCLVKHGLHVFGIFHDEKDSNTILISILAGIKKVRPIVKKCVASAS